MKSKSPYKISLQIEGLTLRARVTNVSKAEQYFLENQLYQPSILKLSDSGGRRVKFDDKHATSDAAWLLSREEYRKMKPGESLEFRSVMISEKPNSPYHLGWFPFESDLEPGKYSAQVEWSSEHNKWEEYDIQQQMQRINGRMKGVWLGKVCSNSAELLLE